MNPPRTTVAQKSQIGDFPHINRYPIIAGIYQICWELMVFRYQAADYLPMEAFEETTRPKQDGDLDVNDHVARFVDKPSILMPLAIRFPDAFERVDCHLAVLCGHLSMETPAKWRSLF